MSPIRVEAYNKPVDDIYPIIEKPFDDMGSFVDVRVLSNGFIRIKIGDKIGYFPELNNNAEFDYTNKLTKQQRFFLDPLIVGQRNMIKVKFIMNGKESIMLVPVMMGNKETDKPKNINDVIEKIFAPKEDDDIKTYKFKLRKK